MCVLLRTSKEVKKDMRSWSLSEGVMDLGGHIDTSLRGWATTLTSRVSAAAWGFSAVAVLPGGFTSKLGLVCSKFLSAALHGCEASKVSQGCLF